MSKENTTSGEIEQSSSGQLAPLVIRHGSLFSGIGGFDLAAQWTGWENVFQVEIDDYCTKVLEKNFPNAKRYRDIRDFNGTQYRGTIDVVSGGFPCQPFSLAGKRKGKEDDRFLWPEMLRVVREVQPRFIVGENVGGIRELVDEICTDLENVGYKAEPIIIEAGAVGANIIRERIWFIASTKSNGNNKREEPYREPETSRRVDQLCKYVGGKAPATKEYFESRVCRIADGVPNRMDRLKGLGNAIVPQVAFEIFRAIDAVSV